MNLRTEKAVQPYVFLLTFEDGRTERVEVSVGCFSAAVLGLPRFSDVGKYKYELLNRKGK